MTVEVYNALKKAKQFLEDAKFNFEGGKFDTVANRAYYSAYTCVKATLLSKDIFAKTHSGTHNQFNQYFIITGIFDSKYATHLARLYHLRQITDYDLSVFIDHESAEMALQYASEIFNLISEWVEENL